MKTFFSLILLCFSQALYAQKAANTWYFGCRVGLDFNTNPPRPLTTCPVTSFEGCSVICDPATGKVLLSTNGVRVYDKRNILLPRNESELLAGHESSSQSAVIVPFPGDGNIYYIFTTTAQVGVWNGNPSMSYSVVDLSLNSGNGDLTKLNAVLIDSCLEKLTVIAANCQASEYWIVGHGWNSDTFYAFKLTRTGLSAPVKSKTGLFIGDDPSRDNTKGCMKFSPDGKHLGVVTGFPMSVQLFDFDAATGIISNPKTETFRRYSTTEGSYDLYGCSFSPNSSKFYFTGTGYFNGNTYIYQYDMNAADIIASRVIVGGRSRFSLAGSIQNGPDGKLYVSISNYDSTIQHIDVINHPDALGTACNYTHGMSFRSLNGENGQSMFSLPSFVENFSSIRRSRIDRLEHICRRDTFDLEEVPKNITSVSPASYRPDADTSLIRFFPDSVTTYTILSRNECGFTDTTYLTIDFLQSLSVNRSEKICAGDTLRIDQTLKSIIDISPGTYILNSDSSQICFVPEDKTIYTILSLNGCGIADTLYLAVDVLPLPEAKFLFSPGEPSVFDAELTMVNESSNGSHYQWFLGSDKISDNFHCSVPISDTGDFCFTMVAVNEQGCLDTASECITIVKSTIFIPNAFTPNGDGKNDGFRSILSGPFQSYRMQIYNRYGEQVFSTDKPEQAWDGTFNRREQELGVYYYLIKVKFGSSDGKEEIYKGDVSLIR